jgi:hypothetical protein
MSFIMNKVIQMTREDISAKVTNLWWCDKCAALVEAEAGVEKLICIKCNKYLSLAGVMATRTDKTKEEQDQYIGYATD